MQAVNTSDPPRGHKRHQVARIHALLAGVTSCKKCEQVEAKTRVIKLRQEATLEALTRVKLVDIDLSRLMEVLTERRARILELKEARWHFQAATNPLAKGASCRASYSTRCAGSRSSAAARGKSRQWHLAANQGSAAAATTAAAAASRGTPGNSSMTSSSRCTGR